MRFAHADFDLFESITDKDFLNYAPRGSKKTTTMTCIDQLTNRVGMSNSYGRWNKYWKDEFVEKVASNMSDYLSYGPTRDDIKMT